MRLLESILLHLYTTQPTKHVARRFIEKPTGYSYDFNTTSLADLKALHSHFTDKSKNKNRPHHNPTSNHSANPSFSTFHFKNRPNHIMKINPLHGRSLSFESTIFNQHPNAWKKTLVQRFIQHPHSIKSDHYLPVKHSSIQWAQHNKITFSQSAHNEFVTLTLLLCDSASQKTKVTLTNFLLWIFIRDDTIDRKASNLGLDGIKKMNQMHGNALMTHHGIQSHGPLENGLRTIVQTLIDHAPSNQKLNRFEKKMMDYFESNYVEVYNREHRILLSIHQYIELRADTIAVYPYLEARFIMDGLPDINRIHRIDEMSILCSKIVGIANDIFSIGKEYTDDYPDNIVLLYQQKYGMSLEEALEKTLNRLMTWFASFNQLKSASYQANDTHEYGYIIAMEETIRGSFIWSVDAARYNAIDPAIGRRINTIIQKYGRSGSFLSS